MESNSFITANRALSKILSNVNDEAVRSGFARGWYISHIADGLSELAMDTHFQKLTRDLPFPSETFSVPIPENGFNVKRIYLFNCTCQPTCPDEDANPNDEQLSVDNQCNCCDTNGSVNVYWKRTYNNNGKGRAHTARIRENGQASQFNDPFMGGLHHHHGSIRGSLHYANIQNGNIMFSPDSGSFNMFRVEYSGFGVDVNAGEVPSIPRFFERYIVHYVSERFYAAMKSRKPRTFRVLHLDEIALLQKAERKARLRISKMDKFERESLNEYLEQMLHK